MERKYLTMQVNPIRMNKDDWTRIEDSLSYLAMVLGQRVRDEALAYPMIIQTSEGRAVGLSSDAMADLLRDVKCLQVGSSRAIQVDEKILHRPTKDEIHETITDAYRAMVAPTTAASFNDAVHNLVAVVEAAHSDGISAAVVIHDMLEAEEDEKCQEDPGDRAQAGLEPMPAVNPDLPKGGERSTEDNTLPAWVSRLQNSAANLAYLKREEGIGEATRQFLNDIAGVFRRGGTDEDVGRTLRLHTDHDERKEQ